ncbi:hypothetical protein H2204_007114 [Knufia peltigerae]|uniref:Major royal jelly protein n=1 Tax=Knufia peltigerae TaxID=1002370 RepID=A0AA39CX34_9EURO|nr:hypothetical protein H2204_007114 [Knufia peltigerae]
MFCYLFALFTLLSTGLAQFPSTCPAAVSSGPGGPLGTCPQDFTIIGTTLQPVHESAQAPTGLAVDPSLNIYLTYPRNSGPTANNVVIATSFTDEKPWPNATIQNCTATQDPSTCFINVQNVVLDSVNQLWIVDSGINPGNQSATPGGAKIMSFDLKGNHLRTYVIPTDLLHDNMNANDVRINNTVGGGKGYAFLTDESKYGSILSINLTDGSTNRRLFNTSVVKPDQSYVGVYDGQPIYAWNGTDRNSGSIGSDGIALASGNVYWGVLSSRRFYYVSQEGVIDKSKTDEEVFAAVQNPGQCGTEQAGFTADDNGRVYILASEHNAIFYVDTLQSQVNETVNGTPPGGAAKVPVTAENYVVKTLARSGLIQHADSAAILDGWLYFCTNQLELSPRFQYNNTDNRRGPFRSYRTWIGAGPAV